ncbi:MAG: DUF2225 domain-containing protein [Clostridiales bacterium]|nr:DUF2225 domain-containing protein [Clostridiales bacterium]
MNLLSGLEKFGLKMDGDVDLFAEEKKAKVAVDGEKKDELPTEESLILEKAIRCTVCDKTFKTKMIKNGRVKRMEPDWDLRPRFEGIDTIKYDVSSCPYCGYTAMNRFFEHLTTGQIKLIKESVCRSFLASDAPEPPIIDYDMAIERYKLSLFNSIAKKAKDSEKAYTCLKIAWLFRGMMETMDASAPGYEQKMAEYKEQELAFYQQAFEGFMKAVSTEMFPMCGMDQCTIDYLLAAMAYRFRKYDVASKCIARIQGSASASKKMKERAYDLKQKIVEQIKKNKE